MPPQHIGKYEITGSLGQGAMGEVLRAHDPLLRRDVAVKRITAGQDADETVRRRFQREAQSAAQLSHPNIITVYELGSEGGQLFMAMELLDGVDLTRALAAGTMRLGQRLDVMEQICQGLAFAHSRGIVHRDLKPANVRILPNGRVKIMDFGLARLSGSEMTAAGMVMGTPYYMSPEQVRGAHADARSDIFALGCVFYEMLTGRKPFDAESVHAVLYKVVQEEPAPLRTVAPATPETLARIVDRALAKNPDERFQDAGELLEHIRRARRTVSGGRGQDATPDLRSSLGAPGTQAGPASQARRNGQGTANRRPRESAAGKKRHRPPLVSLAFGLAVLLWAGWALRHFLVRSQPAGPPPATEVSRLAQAVIDAQVELAHRRLQDGHFTDAARQAEQALKLDPRNAAARRVLDEATSTLTRIDASLAAIRAAGSDRDRLAGAALELMMLDPGHPAAESAATAAGPAFRPRAEEARRLEQESRRLAGGSNAEGSPVFAQGLVLEGQGESALQSEKAVAAARLFLEARGLFERARRSPR